MTLKLHISTQWIGQNKDIFREVKTHKVFSMFLQKLIQRCIPEKKKTKMRLIQREQASRQREIAHTNKTQNKEV